MRNRVRGAGDARLGRPLLRWRRAERAREEEGAAERCVVCGLALADTNGLPRGGVLQHRVSSREEL